ncbi:Nucleoporin POM152 [Yarrowia sp. B02]|nr:Nucleoporin POM152 [Yarrowia sp. B02]
MANLNGPGRTTSSPGFSRRFNRRDLLDNSRDNNTAPPINSVRDQATYPDPRRSSGVAKPMKTFHATQKPWRQEKITVPHKSEPLIPETYMSAANQRWAAVSLFLLFMASKITYLLTPVPPGEQFGLLFKFFALDIVLLWTLPLFRIPWLTFGPVVTTLLSMAFLGFDMGIVYYREGLVFALGLGSAVWRTVNDKELSFSGLKIKVASLQDASSHLIGEHIVQILPKSTALINPMDQPFCLTDSAQTITIPVRLNATGLSSLELKYIDFDKLEEKSYNFTKNQLVKFRGRSDYVRSLDYKLKDADKKKLFYVELPVEKTGLYRLGRVVDDSNNAVRTYMKDVIVGACPGAKLRQSNDSLHLGSNRCIGGTEQPNLVVIGVPPLRIKYSKEIEGQSSVFSVQSVQPRHFVSPIASGDVNRYVWKNGADLNWAVPHEVPIHLDARLSQTGKWVYAVDEVEDGLGNIVNYTAIAKDKDEEWRTRRQLTHEFFVHPRPQVSFRTCSAEKRARLAGDHVNLDLKIQAQEDLVLTIKHTDEYGKAEVFNTTVPRGQQSIPVSKSGIFELEAVHGKYCAGDIVESSECHVYVPPKPSLSVEFTDIQDQCAGPVGATAELAFTGQPPFHAVYRTVRDGQVIDTQKISTHRLRHQLKFKPQSAGTYTYEIVSFSDAVYKQPQETSFTKKQTIRVLAGAFFDKSIARQRFVCSGESVDLPVTLRGLPPFTLEYEIVHGSSRRVPHTVKDIKDEKHVISTSGLSQGGQYTISLVAVTDSHGCRSLLDEQDIRVEVRRQRPSAGFLPISGDYDVAVPQGSPVKLPVTLNGDGPWNVEYEYIDGEKRERHRVQVNDANGFFTVARPGHYRLVSVRDAHCPGEIVHDAIFSLSWIARPAVKIVKAGNTEAKDGVLSRAPICEGDQDSVEIALEGSPPFTVLYRVTGPGGRTKDHEIQVATPFANVRVETNAPGEYEYFFMGVLDSNYYDRKWLADVKAGGDVAFSDSKLRQLVKARPTAKFVDKGRVYRACQGIADSADGIPIKLTGEAPFSLTVSIRVDSSGHTEKVTYNSVGAEFELKSQLYSRLGLGKHTVQIYQVVDARGCRQSNFGADQRVTVHVADTPTITAVEERADFCVGERISYSLTGIPPFDITYDFNGNVRDSTSGTLFRRLAAEPGNLTIKAISDTASSCRIELEGAKQLPKRIHPIPTARVEEGTSLIFDENGAEKAEIHFHLQGTPPFQLQYTRSEMISGKEVVVETHTVGSIKTHTYTIWTGLQGIYRPIVVSDYYCTTAGERASH